MPDPTLTARLDLAVKCGVPYETLVAVGFRMRKGEWIWLGPVPPTSLAAAHSALNAVCVEWLGRKDLFVLPDGPVDNPVWVVWTMAHGEHARPDDADHATFSAAIHAAMLAVSTTKETQQ